MPSPSSRNPRRRAALLGGVGTLAAVVLSGCSAEQVARGWMPSEPGITEHTETILNLWTGNWIAALCIGVLVWGLIIWCVIVYRKRKNDNRLPVQLRYHLPLELLYSFVPIVMVGVLFYYAATIQEDVTSVSSDPDVNVTVYGRQWTWDFVYTDENVWDTGTPADLDGTMAPADDLPTLYLPVDQTVNITLRSRDVAHSFWVPAFLYKEDVLPGVVNEFTITPGEEGVYLGKCAELCGEYHGDMLFNVAVVSQEEYEEHMADLRAAGQTGELGPEYDRDHAADIPDPTAVEGAEN